MAGESEGTDGPAPWRKGDMIRIAAGPCIDFIGIIEQVDFERQKVRADITGLNPVPPIEFGFDQIERP